MIKPRCMFMKKLEYCSKGEYCEFSHDKNDVACTNYARGFCKYGDSCAFSHSDIRNNMILKEDTSSSSRSISDKYSNTPSQNDVIASDESLSNSYTFLEDAWGLEPEHTFLQSTAISNKKSYASVLGKSNQSASEISQLDIEVKQKEICKFYHIGLCKYGSYCRYRHDHDPNSNIDSTANSDFPSSILENNSDNNAITVKDNNLECGICMTIPTNSVYGVLNNCECVFCLSCVREWRREGSFVTKSADTVRLCPLCRRESYYVVPSNKPIPGGQIKEDFLQVYKDTMKNKPCKYYEEDGQCPFGTSCFYKHGNNEEEAVVYTTNRVLYNREGSTEQLINHKVLLSDIIMNQIAR